MNYDESHTTPIRRTVSGMAEPADELKARRQDLRARSQVLHGAAPEPAHAELERVASWCADHQVDADSYGEGAHLQAFEARVADMLGYPAGRFMPSGTMAQQIAIRVWAGRTGSQLVGMHPTCHLELHEQRGYAHLHGLGAVMVGSSDRPMTPSDLEAVAEPIGSLVVELPTRENGGQLAPWSELVELCETAREQGIATHLDGARLWEAAAGYDRPLDDICELFDSAYVSFYKGIGALPGSMLLGSTDFADEAVIWQRRHGGNLYTTMANWASADMRLDEQIAKMPSFLARARELAQVLQGIDGVIVNPAVPHTNMFHVFLRGEAEVLLLAHDRIAEADGLWLFGGLQSTDVPGTVKCELAVGDAALTLSDDAIVNAFRGLTLNVM